MLHRAPVANRLRNVRDISMLLLAAPEDVCVEREVWTNSIALLEERNELSLFRWNPRVLRFYVSLFTCVYFLCVSHCFGESLRTEVFVIVEGTAVAQDPTLRIWTTHVSSGAQTICGSCVKQKAVAEFVILRVRD